MLASVGFSAVGLLILALGVAMLRHDRRRVRNGGRADAEVVGMRESMRRGRRSGLYRPVVRFRAADGREVETETAMGGNPPAARRGDRVRVIYQPGTGGDVVIDNFKGRGLLSVSVLSIIGLALIAIGISPVIPHGSAAVRFVLMLFGGLGFLSGGVVIFYQDRHRVRHGRRAGAEVVDLVRERSHGPDGGGWVYYPVVRFHTEDRQEVVARTRVGSSPPIARPGDQVRIRYEIGNPQNMAIDTIAGRGLVLGGLATLAGLGTLAYMIYHIAR